MVVMYQSLTFLWAVSHLLGTKPRSGGSLPWLSTARYLQLRLRMQMKHTYTQKTVSLEPGYLRHCFWLSTSQPQYHLEVTNICPKDKKVILAIL